MLSHDPQPASSTHLLSSGCPLCLLASCQRTRHSCCLLLRDSLPASRLKPLRDTALKHAAQQLMEMLMVLLTAVATRAAACVQLSLRLASSLLVLLLLHGLLPVQKLVLS